MVEKGVTFVVTSIVIEAAEAVVNMRDVSFALLLVWCVSLCCTVDGVGLSLLFVQFVASRVVAHFVERALANGTSVCAVRGKVSDRMQLHWPK